MALAALTEAALERGDKVAATARNLNSLAGLKEKYGENVLPLELDVTKPGQAGAAVTQAHVHFGRLDIVLNNAGYSLVGTIEEASAEDVKAMYETNIFGALAVIQAALPLLRKQGGGHILGTSSNVRPRNAAGNWLLLLVEMGIRSYSRKSLRRG